MLPPPRRKTENPLPPLTVVPKSTEQPATKIQTLDERVNRINELIELQKKYTLLQSSEQKLAEFKMKKGAENIELSIEDENIRSVFSTKNPDVISEVLETVTATIQKRKKEIEPLLMW